MTGCNNRASERFISSKHTFKHVECQIISAPSNIREAVCNSVMHRD